MRDRIVFTTIRRHLPPRGILYDVGCREGRYGNHFSTSHRVYGFDPNPTRRNGKFRVFPLALGAEDGTTTLFTHSRDYFNSINEDAVREKVKNRAGEIHCESVRMVRMDTVIEEENLEPPDLIKIDVQGAEFAVLQGAQHTLRTHHPILVIEVHTNLLPLFGSSSRELMDFLVRLGYEIQFLAARGDDHHILALPHQTHRKADPNH